MIDLKTETLIPLREVPQVLPPRPTGKRVHISACYRWMSRGVRGGRLEVIRIGGSTYTSQDALQWFGERRAAARAQPGEAATARPRERQRQIERAARRVAEELGRRKRSVGGTDRSSDSRPT